MPGILVITYCLPSEYAKWLFSKDSIPAIQTNTFSHELVRSLESTGQPVEVISSPPAQDYPLCPIEHFPQSKIEFPIARGHVFSSSNRPIRKRLRRFSYVLTHTLRRRPEYVIFHGLYFPYVFAGSILRILGYKTGLVLTDPPGVILHTDGITRIFLKKFETKFVQVLTRRFSFGIALSESIAEKYLGDRPTLVFPGFFPGVDQVIGKRVNDSDTMKTKDRRIRIGYFGGLFPGYGVTELAETISESNLPVDFDIFGIGPETIAIGNIAARDARITLKGMVDRDLALKKMREYDVLVNPRVTGTNMERNSFPSKIFDYATARRPIITTPLSGLPDDIRQLLIEYSPETKQGAIIALTTALGMSSVEMNKLGSEVSIKMAQKFSAEKMGTDISAFLGQLA
jgi:hypothetical protein